MLDLKKITEEHIAELLTMKREVEIRIDAARELYERIRKEASRLGSSESGSPQKTEEPSDQEAVSDS